MMSVGPIASVVAAVLSGTFAVTAWRASVGVPVAESNALVVLQHSIAEMQDKIERLDECISALATRPTIPERNEGNLLGSIDLTVVQSRLVTVEDGLDRLRLMIERAGESLSVPAGAVIQKDPFAVSQAIAACRTDSKEFVATHRFWFVQDVYRIYGAPDRMQNAVRESPLWIYSGRPGEGGFAMRIGASGVQWATAIPEDMATTWPNSK